MELSPFALYIASVMGSFKIFFAIAATVSLFAFIVIANDDIDGKDPRITKHLQYLLLATALFVFAAITVPDAETAKEIMASM